jgi:hypothetical protein
MVLALYVPPAKKGFNVDASESLFLGNIHDAINTIIWSWRSYKSHHFGVNIESF